MKFLVDENLSPRLATHLAQRGYDATSLRDRGRLGKKDSAVLDMALDEDRIIGTANDQPSGHRRRRRIDPC